MGMPRDREASQEGVGDGIGDSPAGVAERLARKGDEAARAGRHDEALELFERVVGQFGDVREPEVRRWVVGAMGRRADVLEELGSLEASLAVRDALVARFGEDQAPRVMYNVSVALDGKARLLERL
jgi:hypothetical protein